MICEFVTCFCCFCLSFCLLFLLFFGYLWPCHLATFWCFSFELMALGCFSLGVLALFSNAFILEVSGFTSMSWSSPFFCWNSLELLSSCHGLEHIMLHRCLGFVVFWLCLKSFGIVILRPGSMSFCPLA